jgi:hypothetical protein
MQAIGNSIGFVSILVSVAYSHSDSINTLLFSYSTIAGGCAHEDDDEEEEAEVENEDGDGNTNDKVTGTVSEGEDEFEWM